MAIKIILEGEGYASPSDLALLGKCACGGFEYYILRKDENYTEYIQQFCSDACKWIYETRQSWAKEYGVSI